MTASTHLPNPDKRQIAAWIRTTFDPRATIQLDDAVEAALRSLRPELPDRKLYELLEQNLDDVRAQLERDLAAAEESLRLPSFSLEQDYLVGCDARASSGILTQRLLSKSLRELTPNEFEDLGFALLSAMGPDRIYKTPRTRDGAVDMYSLFNLPTFRGLAPVRCLICAEAKRRVHFGVPDIRNFAEGATIAVSNRLRGLPGKIPLDFPIGSHSPILLLMMSSCTVSQDADDHAKNQGITIWEDAHIAQRLMSYLQPSSSPVESLREFIRKYNPCQTT